VNPSIPIAAVLLEAPSTRAWLETWRDRRAYDLGWRPAYAAEVTSDGRVLLAWDNFSELSMDFESCCQALARSWAGSAAHDHSPERPATLRRFDSHGNALSTSYAHGEQAEPPADPPQFVDGPYCEDEPRRTDGMPK
jgi:hypothetical protein